MHTIERAVREAVPTLADYSLVHVVDGARIRCVAGAHVSRPGQMLVRALMRRGGIRLDDLVSSAAQVIRTKRPMLRPHIRPETDPSPSTRGVLGLQHRLGPRSVLVVPIAIAGAVQGALSLCYAESGRVYSTRQMAAARRLARHIADVLAAVPAVPASSRRRPLARS